MDAQEATRTFKQAEALYAKGRHEEALQLLEQLDRTFPNTKNILYPKALCLAALGRKDEAAAACDALDMLQDPRAQAIRERLRPAAGGDDLDAALNVNLLGDFDRPAPKRAPAVVEAPNRTPLYAGIAGAVAVVLIVAAVFYTGVLGKLFPKRETVEEALAKITASSDSIKAMSGVFTAEASVTQPQALKINCSGDFDFLLKDDKPMFLCNIAIVVENMGGASQSMKIVSDGDTMFQEMNMMGQVMVMKVPMPGGGSQQMTPGDIMNKVKEFGEVSLEEDEMVDEMPAYVFSVKPSPTTKLPEGLPKIGDIKAVVVKESGMLALLEVKDEAGAMLLKASTMRVVVNSPSSPDKFKYTPPQGVQVMDMSEAQGKMPFSFPGM